MAYFITNPYLRKHLKDLNINPDAPYLADILAQQGYTHLLGDQPSTGARGNVLSLLQSSAIHALNLVPEGLNLVPSLISEIARTAKYGPPGITLRQQIGTGEKTDFLANARAAYNAPEDVRPPSPIGESPLPSIPPTYTMLANPTAAKVGVLAGTAISAMAPELLLGKFGAIRDLESARLLAERGGTEGFLSAARGAIEAGAHSPDEAFAIAAKMVKETPPPTGLWAGLGPRAAIPRAIRTGISFATIGGLQNGTIDERMSNAVHQGAFGLFTGGLGPVAGASRSISLVRNALGGSIIPFGEGLQGHTLGAVVGGLFGLLHQPFRAPTEAQPKLLGQQPIPGRAPSIVPDTLAPSSLAPKQLELFRSLTGEADPRITTLDSLTQTWTQNPDSLEPETRAFLEEALGTRRPTAQDFVARTAPLAPGEEPPPLAHDTDRQPALPLDFPPERVTPIPAPHRVPDATGPQGEPLILGPGGRVVVVGMTPEAFRASEKSRAGRSEAGPREPITTADISLVSSQVANALNLLPEPILRVGERLSGRRLTIVATPDQTAYYPQHDVIAVNVNLARNASQVELAQVLHHELIHRAFELSDVNVQHELLTRLGVTGPATEEGIRNIIFSHFQDVPPDTTIESISTPTNVMHFLRDARGEPIGAVSQTVHGEESVILTTKDRNLVMQLYDMLTTGGTFPTNLDEYFTRRLAYMMLRPDSELPTVLAESFLYNREAFIRQNPTAANAVARFIESVTGRPVHEALNLAAPETGYPIKGSPYYSPGQLPLQFAALGLPSDSLVLPVSPHTLGATPERTLSILAHDAKPQNAGEYLAALDDSAETRVPHLGYRLEPSPKGGEPYVVWRGDERVPYEDYILEQYQTARAQLANYASRVIGTRLSPGEGANGNALLDEFDALVVQSSRYEKWFKRVQEDPAADHGFSPHLFADELAIVMMRAKGQGLNVPLSDRDTLTAYRTLRAAIAQNENGSTQDILEAARSGVTSSTDGKIYKIPDSIPDAPTPGAKTSAAELLGLIRGANAELSAPLESGVGNLSDIFDIERGGAASVLGQTGFVTPGADLLDHQPPIAQTLGMTRDKFRRTSLLDAVAYLGAESPEGRAEHVAANLGTSTAAIEAASHAMRGLPPQLRSVEQVVSILDSLGFKNTWARAAARVVFDALPEEAYAKVKLSRATLPEWIAARVQRDELGPRVDAPVVAPEAPTPEPMMPIEAPAPPPSQPSAAPITGGESKAKAAQAPVVAPVTEVVHPEASALGRAKLLARNVRFESAFRKQAERAMDLAAKEQAKVDARLNLEAERLAKRLAQEKLSALTSAAKRAEAERRAKEAISKSVATRQQIIRNRIAQLGQQKLSAMMTLHDRLKSHLGTIASQTEKIRELQEKALDPRTSPALRAQLSRRMDALAASIEAASTRADKIRSDIVSGRAETAGISPADLEIARLNQDLSDLAHSSELDALDLTTRDVRPSEKVRLGLAREALQRFGSPDMTISHYFALPPELQLKHLAARLRSPELAVSPARRIEQLRWFIRARETNADQFPLIAAASRKSNPSEVIGAVNRTLETISSPALPTLRLSVERTGPSASATRVIIFDTITNQRHAFPNAETAALGADLLIAARRDTPDLTPPGINAVLHLPGGPGSGPTPPPIAPDGGAAGESGGQIPPVARAFEPDLNAPSGRKTFPDPVRSWLDRVTGIAWNISPKVDTAYFKATGHQLGLTSWLRVAIERYTRFRADEHAAISAMANLLKEVRLFRSRGLGTRVKAFASWIDDRTTPIQKQLVESGDIEGAERAVREALPALIDQARRDFGLSDREVTLALRIYGPDGLYHRINRLAGVTSAKGTIEWVWYSPRGRLYAAGLPESAQQIAFRPPSERGVIRREGEQGNYIPSRDPAAFFAQEDRLREMSKPERDRAEEHLNSIRDDYRLGEYSKDAFSEYISYVRAAFRVKHMADPVNDLFRIMNDAAGATGDVNFGSGLNEFLERLLIRLQGYPSERDIARRGARSNQYLAAARVIRDFHDRIRPRAPEPVVRALEATYKRLAIDASTGDVRFLADSFLSFNRSAIFGLNVMRAMRDATTTDLFQLYPRFDTRDFSKAWRNVVLNRERRAELMSQAKENGLIDSDEHVRFESANSLSRTVRAFDFGLSYLYKRNDLHTRLMALELTNLSFERAYKAWRLAGPTDAAWNDFIETTALDTYHPEFSRGGFGLETRAMLERGETTEVVKRLARIHNDIAVFNYLSPNHPQFYDRPVGRLFGQYATWPINAVNSLYRMYRSPLDVHGGARGVRRALTVTLKGVAAAEAIYSMGAYLGVDTSSWIPFVHNMTYGGGPAADLGKDIVDFFSGDPDVQRAYASNPQRTLVKLVQRGVPIPGGDIIKRMASQLYDGEEYRRDLGMPDYQDELSNRLAVVMGFVPFRYGLRPGTRPFRFPYSPARIPATIQDRLSEASQGALPPGTFGPAEDFKSIFEQ